MWGTDTGGCLWKPMDRKDEKLLDVPQCLENVSSTLLMGTDSTTTTTMMGYTIRKVICGPTDTAVLTTTNQCFVTGENKHGQLGLGHTQPVLSPTEIILQPQDSSDDSTSSSSSNNNNRSAGTIVDVAFGSALGAFVDSKGDLYTAGFGGSTLAGVGCLGHGDIMSRHKATLVESLVEDGCQVQQVCAGESHMTALTTEGEVLCTGSGSYGRLGNFETIDQLYLEPVELLTVETGITQIAGGKSFTLALSKEGVVYGWGRNHKVRSIETLCDRKNSKIHHCLPKYIHPSIHPFSGSTRHRAWYVCRHVCYAGCTRTH